MLLLENSGSATFSRLKEDDYIRNEKYLQAKKEKKVGVVYLDGQKSIDSEDHESVEQERKRQKVGNEKSRIFFVVDQASNIETECKVWYEIDLNDVGSPARRMKKQPPFFIHTVLGSCDSFLYSLGGMTCTYSDPAVPYLRTPLDKNYFYDTAKPEDGWFEGPPMRSPRDGLSHQVIGSKIYALGGASVRNDYCVKGWDLPSLFWGEYLDVSLPRNEWQWCPVKTSFSCGNGILDDEDCILSLPLFFGGFDPLRHVLCCCDTMRSRFLVYNVDDGSLCRVFEECHLAFNKLSPDVNVFVEGDCIVTPDSTRVLVIRSFESSSSSWFVGGVRSDDNHFPPMPKQMVSWFHRDPASFSLVRIAPCKYAAFWVPKRDEPFVILSVFTVIPPLGRCSVDLHQVLETDLLCVDDVQAIFEVDHVRIPLPDYEIACFNIKAAVAL